MEVKQIGWFCSYTPVEIIEAAGFSPYGIREDSGHGHEDVYLGDSICSYVRSCMGGALSGSYDFLSGVVITHSCECMRRLYDGWSFKQNEIIPECLYLLDVPRVYDERSVAYFARQLGRFREMLEKRFGMISDAKLIETIKKYDLTRELFMRVLELRKRDNPPVSGVEAASLIRESITSPRDEFNRKLTAFLDEKENSIGRCGPRIMIYGGPTNHSLAGLIEDAGGIVVYENTCNGFRGVESKYNPNEEPITGLARRYLGKNPCPRMLGACAEKGLEDIKRLAESFRADGIIYFSIKFCANLHSLAGMIKNEFDADIPIKLLEGDIGSQIDEREIRSFIKNLGMKPAGKSR